MILFSSLLPLLLFASSTLVTQSNNKHYSGQNNLFSWIQQNGGFINSKKLEISSGSKDWNVRGLFATQSLGKGELLVTLPPSLRICSPIEELESNERVCYLIKKLIKELNKGTQSFYWPYLNTLMGDGTCDVHEIPLSWSDDALKWLEGLGLTMSVNDWKMNLAFMKSECRLDVTDAKTLCAGSLVFSRATGINIDGYDVQCMCPVYDLMNHDNLRLNTAGAVYPNQVLGVGTTVEVAAGGQIFNSFSLNNNVVTLFRDYGFITSYPRVWEFSVPLPNEGDDDSNDNNEMISFSFIELNSEEIEFNYNSHRNKKIFLSALEKHLEAVKNITSSLIQRASNSSALDINNISSSESAVYNNEGGKAIHNLTSTKAKQIARAKEFRAEYIDVFTRALQSSRSEVEKKRKKLKNKTRKKSIFNNEL